MTKTMKKGFTLVEILVAVTIFLFMMLALSGVFATANRYFHQQFREDILKTRFIIAMKYIQNKLIEASEIETPQPGNQSTDIAFISNAIRNPANTSQVCRVVSSVTSQWHRICWNSSTKTLYYYSSNISIPDCSTLTYAPLSIPPVSCGTTPGGIFLTDYVDSVTFQRMGGSINGPSNLIRVYARLYAPSPGADTSYAGKIGKDIEQEYETYITLTKSTQY